FLLIGIISGGIDGGRYFVFIRPSLQGAHKTVTFEWGICVDEVNPKFCQGPPGCFSIRGCPEPKGFSITVGLVDHGLYFCEVLNGQSSQSVPRRNCLKIEP